MKITIKEVQRVARLARLELSESEKEKFTHQLNDILEAMDKLNELDTENVEPTSHVLAIKNIFKDDEPSESFSLENMLANAPEKERGLVSVPKIIE